MERKQQESHFPTGFKSLLAGFSQLIVLARILRASCFALLLGGPQNQESLS